MAESIKLLKKRASQLSISMDSTNEKLASRTITGISLVENGCSGRDPFEGIRRKISKPKIVDPYSDVASGGTKQGTTFPRLLLGNSQPKKPKLTGKGLSSTNPKNRDLVDKHLREGRTSVSPRFSLSSDSPVNQNLLQKYLGPSKDTDFLKIPDFILNPTKGPLLRAPSFKVKQRAISPRRQKAEILELPEEEERVISGSLDNLPPEISNVVRVFISSTFRDFKEERNAILKIAYPVLKNFCSWLGLEFHLVDMRWGITDEATNDHLTESLCLKEIEHCNRVSFGPSFVCFVGDRYGYRPIPHELDAIQFDNLCTIAEELQLDHNPLLRKWYVKDNNARPPLYTIQPINTFFPHFDDRRPEVRRNREENQRLWNLELQRLQKLFQQAAKAAEARGILSRKIVQRITMSVTEMEITQALESNRKDILCFQRELIGLDQNSENPIAMEFTDVHHSNEVALDENVDEDAKAQRKHLANKLKAAVKADNLCSFNVKWFEDGISASTHIEHSKYLNSLCTVFLKRIQTLIQNQHDIMLKSQARDSKTFKQLRQEILHHSHFCNTKCNIFHGREIEIQLVKALFESSKRSPLMVTAKSGAGKTALVAKIAQSASGWLGQSCVRVIRFLGTSPDSSNINATLCSICRQICLAYGISLNESSLMETQTVVKYFHELLNIVSLEHARYRPLLILLDSVDQLSPVDNAHRLQWIPTEPPQGVRIVISFIPGMYGLYNRAKEIFPLDSHYIKILPLTVNSCLTIVDMYLNVKNRTLTAEQMCLLRSYFNHHPPLPLLLKMIVDDACNWTSTLPPSLIELPLRIEDAIEGLFVKIERTYGTKLVAYTFGYLTVSQNGLTELELKDTLSCNDEVVNEIFQYHDPPVSGTVRVPHLFWTQIKHEIADYVVERQTDGKTTFFWYHRQFIIAARKRYVTDEVRQRLHADLAEIFLAENGVYKTITLHKRNLLVEDANRQVTPQPLTEYNHRKLRALSYHLLYSGQIDALKEHALCNLFYLVCRIKAFSVGDLLHEFSRVLSIVKDPVIQLVAECIRQAHALIQHDVLQLAVQLLGRLEHLGEEHPMIVQLCHQAKIWFREQQRPVLAPVTTCFPVNSGSNVLWQLDGPTKLIGFHEKAKFTLGFCPSDYSHSTQLQVIDQQEQKVVFTITQFDGYLRAAEIMEISRYKIKIMVLTEKTLRVTLFSIGGVALESRYLSTDFADADHHISLSALGFYEQYRFNRYLLRFVLASENNIFDIPERQYLNEDIDQKHPDLIHTGNSLQMSTQNHMTALKVIPSGYIITCYGVGDNPSKNEKSRGALVVWEEGRRAFQTVLPSPVTNSKMIVFCTHDEKTVLLGCKGNEVVIVSRIFSKWKAQLLKPDTSLGNMVTLAYNGECKLAISVSEKRLAALYSIEKEAGLFKTHLENVKPVTCASITHTGSHVITGHSDGEVAVWKLDRNKGFLFLIKNIRSHTEAITEIYMQAERLVLVLSEDRTLKCFSQSSVLNADQDGASRKQSRNIQGTDPVLAEQLSINDVIISEKDLLAVTSSEDSPPKVWRMVNGKYVRSLSARMSEEGTLKISFGLKQKFIVSRTTKNMLKLWCYETGETLKTPTVGGIFDFAITRNSATVVALQSEWKCMKVTMYDMERHAVTKILQIDHGARLQVDRMFLTDDNKFMVLALRTKGMDNITSRILKAVDLERPGDDLIPCLKNLNVYARGAKKAKHDIATYCAGALDNSKVLVGKNGEAFCWDISKQKSARQKIPTASEVQSLYHSYIIHSHLNDPGTQTNPIVTQALSTDGKLLATADTEGFVIVWKLQKPRVIARDVGNFEILHKHADTVTAMVFSRNGEILMTGSADQTIKVWDTATGRLKHQVHTGMEVVSLTIASEKGYLVALTRGKRQSRVMIFKMLCMD